MANGEGESSVGSPVPMPNVASPAATAGKIGDAVGAIGNVAKAASFVPGPVGTVAKTVGAGADAVKNVTDAAGDAAPDDGAGTSDTPADSPDASQAEADAAPSDAPTMKDAAGAVGDAAGTVSKVAGAAKFIPGIGAAAAGVQAGADAVGKAAKVAGQALPDAPIAGSSDPSADAAAQAKQMADTVGNVAKLASHVPGPIGTAAKVAGAAAPMASNAAGAADKLGLGGGLGGGKGGKDGKPKDDPLKSMAKDAAKKWLIAHALPIVGTVLLVGIIIATPMALTQCSSSGNSNKSTERTEMAIPKIAQYQADNSNTNSSNSSDGNPNYSGEAQSLADANEKQKKLVEYAKKEPTTGPGTCATWTSYVYANMGINFGGNGNTQITGHHYTDLKDLKVGMLIATNATGSDLGSQYGHVGIYIGDGMVMDNESDYSKNIGFVKTTPLDEWIKTFSKYSPVYFGWANNGDAKLA